MDGYPIDEQMRHYPHTAWLHLKDALPQYAEPLARLLILCRQPDYRMNFADKEYLRNVCHIELPIRNEWDVVETFQQAVIKYLDDSGDVLAIKDFSEEDE